MCLIDLFDSAFQMNKLSHANDMSIKVKNDVILYIHIYVIISTCVDKAIKSHTHGSFGAYCFASRFCITTALASWPLAKSVCLYSLFKIFQSSASNIYFEQGLIVYWRVGGSLGARKSGSLRAPKSGSLRAPKCGSHGAPKSDIRDT